MISIENDVIKTKSIIEFSKQKDFQSDDDIVYKKDGEDEKSQKKNENGDKKSIIHVVKSGDNLGSIVDAHQKQSPGLTIEILKDFNIEDPKSLLDKREKEELSKERLKPGMELIIPVISQ